MGITKSTAPNATMVPFKCFNAVPWTRGDSLGFIYFSIGIKIFSISFKIRSKSCFEI